MGSSPRRGREFAAFGGCRETIACSKMAIDALLLVFKLAASLVILPLVIAIVLFKWKESRRRPPCIGGFVDPEFQEVAEVFADNLSRRWERDGAAFCLYYKGKCVIDLWGGLADSDSLRPWTRDTNQITFSTSKALAAVCIGLLVDKGHIDYSQKISTFWPEFAKNGKEDITVEMVLNHTAGLALLHQEITWEDARDPKRMATILEEQTPYWEPGTAVGYHAFSFGWLIDQIIRRADPQGRSSGQFFREEIAEKHDLDVHIGLPREEAWRVARLTRPSLWNRVDEWLTDRETVNYFFVCKQYITKGIALRVANNPSWLQSIFNVTLNNPDVYQLEQPAALAIGTARDMARFAQLLIDGKIIQKETLRLLDTNVIFGRDLVSGAFSERGRGVTVVGYQRGTIKARLVGHAGLGGQNLRWDVENELALCYLSNGLKGGLGDRARSYVRVLDTVFDCIEKCRLRQANE